MPGESGREPWQKTESIVKRVTYKGLLAEAQAGLARDVKAPGGWPQGELSSPEDGHGEPFLEPAQGPRAALAGGVGCPAGTTGIGGQLQPTCHPAGEARELCSPSDLLSGQQKL